MQRRTGIALLAIVAGTLGAATWLSTPRGRGRLAEARESIRRSSLPSARLYELALDPLLDGFFRQVTQDVVRVSSELARTVDEAQTGGSALMPAAEMLPAAGAALRPRAPLASESGPTSEIPPAGGTRHGRRDSAAAEETAVGDRSRERLRILEVGAGPGTLSVMLARALATSDIVASDVDPAMLSRARTRFRRAGLASDVSVEEADVSLLPYPDGSFDLVVSTFSLHHWPDQVRGLDEIRRVLRPGGRALVYDLPEAWRRLETGAFTMERAAELSGFGGGAVTAIEWPWRFHAVRRLLLER